jgi:hypothetical protein
MAGWLTFVEVIALVAHVNTGAAWVLTLHFITRLAWLVITWWSWTLWATLTAWRAAVAGAVTSAVT